MSFLMIKATDFKDIDNNSLVNQHISQYYEIINKLKPLQGKGFGSFFYELNIALKNDIKPIDKELITEIVNSNHFANYHTFYNWIAKIQRDEKSFPLKVEFQSPSAKLMLKNKLFKKIDDGFIGITPLGAITIFTEIKESENNSEDNNAD